MKARRTRFGAHLRRMRLERSGLAVDSVRRIERGAFSPSLDTLGKLTDGLQVSLRTLFDGFERGRSGDVAEICDFLSSRDSGELRIISRVIHAILEE